MSTFAKLAFLAENAGDLIGLAQALLADPEDPTLYQIAADALGDADLPNLSDFVQVTQQRLSKPTPKTDEDRAELQALDTRLTHLLTDVHHELARHHVTLHTAASPNLLIYRPRKKPLYIHLTTDFDLVMSTSASGPAQDMDWKMVSQYVAAGVIVMVARKVSVATQTVERGSYHRDHTSSRTFANSYEQHTGVETQTSMPQRVAFIRAVELLRTLYDLARQLYIQGGLAHYMRFVNRARHYQSESVVKSIITRAMEIDKYCERFGIVIPDDYLLPLREQLRSPSEQDALNKIVPNSGKIIFQALQKLSGTP